MEIEERLTDEEKNLSNLTNKELIESYQETVAFLKTVTDEIKNTNIGDSDE